MKEVEIMSSWSSAIEDFRRFRKGEISMEEMISRYPKFEIREGWGKNSRIKEAIRVVIPEDCPLPVIPQLVHAMEEENGDICLIDYDIRIAYQPVWESFPQSQWGRLKRICDDKEPVVFRIALHGPNWRWNKEPCIDIRYCVREGSHGDSDGYGIEDDTWLVALLNEDGTWFKEWFIED